MDALVETIQRRKNIDYKELYTEGLKPEITNMLVSSETQEVTKNKDPLKRKRNDDKEAESSTLKVSLKDLTFLVENNTNDLAI